MLVGIISRRGPIMRVHETPDGRYIVVGGRLWWHHRPDLEPMQRDRLVRKLIDARRAVRAARRSGDGVSLSQARGEFETVKNNLGERGPVWWADGAPDLNRRMIKSTAYADWYAQPAGYREG